MHDDTSSGDADGQPTDTDDSPEPVRGLPRWTYLAVGITYMFVGGNRQVDEMFPPMASLLRVSGALLFLFGVGRCFWRRRVRYWPVVLLGCTLAGISALMMTARKEVIASRFVAQGNEAARDGNHERAVQLYTEAIFADNLSWEALYNRASSHVRLGELAAAAKDLERAFEINEDSLDVLLLRGAVHSEMGDVASALADAEIALQKEPGSTKALALRSTVNATHGNYEAAKTDLDVLIERDSTNAAMYVQRGLVQEELGNSKAAQADFEIARGLDPTLFEDGK